MLHLSPTKEARPNLMDWSSEEEKTETYSGSGCSTGGSWGGRFWSEHLSQLLCRPTVPYTPHTEEVDPNRDSIVSKDSSTSGSFLGISVNKLVIWLQPCEKSSLCLAQSSSCSLIYLGLMISNRSHDNYNLPDNNGSCLCMLQISTVDVNNKQRISPQTIIIIIKLTLKQWMWK